MDTLSKACMVILAGCLVCVAATAVRQSRGDVGPSAPTGVVADWRSYATTGHRLGVPEAPVTVVAFIDYECPFSRRLADTLARIQHRLPSLVSVVYRNFPLGVHGHDREAARAVECAAEQGRFPEYHQLLIREFAKSLTADTWRNLAVRSGVKDTESFATCLRSLGRATSENGADSLDGSRLGIVGIPTLLVNDEKYEGLPTDLSRIVTEAVASAQGTGAQSRARQ